MAQGNGAAVAEQTEVDRLVDRLNDPRTARALNSLLDNVELLAVLVEGLDGVARKGEIIGDTIAEVIDQMRAASQSTGLDLQQTTGQLATLIPALAEASPAIRRVVSSPIVEPEPIAILSEAAESLVDGLERAQKANARVTWVGLMRASRDQDVQRGLGFLVEVLRSFGRDMSKVRVRQG